MLDNTRTVIDFLSAILTDKDFSFATKIGEPGYEFEPDASVPLLVMADYWCRCDTFDNDLHSIDKHYPNAFERMEANGVMFEWFDEWTIDYERGKAYRCSPDSYTWQPSYVLTDDGEFLTPDDDAETWIEWAVNDPEKCLMGHIYDGNAIEPFGFVRHNGVFENGWHPGQADRPQDIDQALREQYGDATDVIFVLDETGQFDIAFSAYWRNTATNIGRQHGENAAQWWIQHHLTNRGVFTVSNARRALDGIENGDPAITDTLPSPDLSGEWSDDYNSHDLYEELATPHTWQAARFTGNRTCEACGLLPLDSDDDDTVCDGNDDACNEYEAAFREAVESEIMRACREVLA